MYIVQLFIHFYAGCDANIEHHMSNSNHIFCNRGYNNISMMLLFYQFYVREKLGSCGS